MQALSKATPGETYTIQWMFGQPEVLDFLHSHSVDEGERIQLIQKMRDCVIIGAKDSRFAMGNEIADRIQVRENILWVIRIKKGKQFRWNGFLFSIKGP